MKRFALNIRRVNPFPTSIPEFEVEAAIEALEMQKSCVRSSKVY